MFDFRPCSIVFRFARLAAALETMQQHAEAVKAYEQAAWLAQSRDGDAAAAAEYEGAVERVRRALCTGAGRLSHHK